MTRGKNAAFAQRHWLAGFIGVLTLLLAGCGTAATPTPVPPTATTAPATATAAPTAAPANTAAPASTAAPAAPTNTPTPIPTVIPTLRPTEAVASRDDITIVINQEPNIPDPWLSTTLYPNQIVQNIAQPFSFFGPDFKDAATVGFTGWEQIDANRWRLHLRQGIKFHNGEPWNAEAAKFTIDTLGSDVKLQPFSQIRESHGEVVDEYTVDFVTDIPNPMLPRFGQYHIFLAPEWRKGISTGDYPASGEIIGWGPYKFKEWRRGSSMILEADPDYVEPDPVTFQTQRPSIKNVTYVWRNEEIVRAAMIRAGEGDVAWQLAVDLAPELNASPNSKTVKIVSGEIATANVDTIWHPELRKLKVRQALVHAIDCENLAMALFGPESKCSSGPNGIPGTLGVTEENAKPIYTYDPEKARQLLAEAGYNPENRIDYWTREGRYAKDVEIAEALGGMWAEVGINVKINIVENSVWDQKHLTGPAEAYKAALEAGKTPEEAAAAVHESEPPAPCHCSPGLVFFAPGGEYFDFGRQINFYMSCAANRSKNCQADWHDLGVRALAASGAERERLMQETYETFSENVLHLPLMELVSVWGVNKDLDFVNMPGGRRLLVNTMSWTN